MSSYLRKIKRNNKVGEINYLNRNARKREYDLADKHIEEADKLIEKQEFDRAEQLLNLAAMNSKVSKVKNFMFNKIKTFLPSKVA